MKLPHSFICSKCAKDKGGKWPKGHVATCHEGVCKYCNGKAMLANIGDYNWPDRKRHGMRD